MLCFVGKQLIGSIEVISIHTDSQTGVIQLLSLVHETLITFNSTDGKAVPCEQVFGDNRGKLCCRFFYSSVLFSVHASM